MRTIPVVGPSPLEGVSVREVESRPTQTSSQLPSISSLEDPALDTILLTSALALLTARDERVRHATWHDLMESRGHFKRAEAKVKQEFNQQNSPGTVINAIVGDPSSLRHILDAVRHIIPQGETS
jgi:hypothetical protein